jgi:hypothetical protein
MAWIVNLFNNFYIYNYHISREQEHYILLDMGDKDGNILKFYFGHLKFYELKQLVFLPESDFQIRMATIFIWQDHYKS